MSYVLCTILTYLLTYLYREDTVEQRGRGHGSERGVLDCKQLNAPCRGFPPCCQNNVCYWESGFSPTRVRSRLSVCIFTVETHKFVIRLWH